MGSTMESASTETKTYKEGQLIKGKDFIRLESPLVLPSKNTPLLTEAQDFVGAINELFTSGTGADGAFRAVLDDNAGGITIVVGKTPKDTPDEQHCDYLYSYEYVDWSDEIVTNTTTANGTVKKTQTFTKRIITQLVTNSGEVLFVTEYDEKTGKITRYSDGADMDIHTAEWRTEPVAIKTQSEGANSAAIAWCIARNLEQANSLAEQKKMFKKGLKQGVDGGADITEEFEQDSTVLDITPDENGGVSAPFIGTLTEGIYCTAEDGSYVKMYLDMSWENIEETASGNVTTTTGRMVYEAYDANGNFVKSDTSIGNNGMWGWQQKYMYTNGAYQTRNVVKLYVDGCYVSCTHVQINPGYSPQYFNLDWSPLDEDIINAMKKAVRVGNVPPEIIN